MPIPDTADPPAPPGRRVQAVLLGASTLTVMAGAIISPGLPGLKAAFADLDHAEVLAKLVVTVPGLFIALTAGPVGRLLDAVGRKKVLLAGLLLYVLAGTSGLYLQSLPAILGGRVLLGLAVAAVMTAATALGGDYFAGPARVRFLGLQATAMALGGVVFVSAGGALAGLSWRAPFAVYLAPLLLLPLAAAWVREPPRPPRGPATGGPTAFTGRAPLIYLTGFMGMLFFVMVPLQVPFLIAAGGLPRPGISGLAIATTTLLGAVASFSFRPLADRFSRWSLAAAMFALMGAGFALVGLGGGLATIFVGLAIAGLGSGLQMPNLTGWLMSETEPAVRGRAVGLLTAGIFAGQFASPLAIQPVVEGLGLPQAFEVAAGILLLLAAAFFVAGRTLRAGREPASAVRGA